MWWATVNAIRPLRSGRGVLDPWLHGGTHRAKQEFTFFIARYGFSTKRGVGPLIRDNRPSIGPIPTSRRSSSVGTPRARSVHPARHVSPHPVRTLCLPRVPPSSLSSSTRRSDNTHTNPPLPTMRRDRQGASHAAIPASYSGCLHRHSPRSPAPIRFAYAIAMPTLPRHRVDAGYAALC